MAHEITVPRLGWSMEQGTFLGWLKQPGEYVKPGDVLYELEGEKAAQEVEAVDAGILCLVPGGPVPGDTVQVGAVLGYLTAEGESPAGAVVAPVQGGPTAVDQSPAGCTTAAQDPVAFEPGLTAVVSPAVSPAASPAASPAVRRLARELGVSLTGVAGSGPAGRISADDVRLAAERPASPGSVPGEAVVATPRARRRARELGVHWQGVSGTGRNGRIRAGDVERVAQSGGAKRSLAARTAGSPPRGQFAVSPRRRLIAERMLASGRQTAPVTLTMRADATQLVQLRQVFKTGGQNVVPAYTDIVAKLVALALAHHPLLASRWEGDRIVPPTRYDMGIAVDAADGLLVPVVADVPALSLVKLAVITREMADRARLGQLTAAEMQGGVFTITNLGSYGVEAFTPIINFPETSILGLGAIRREAVVLENDVLAARDQMTLSLTFDHRVVDGAPAARFLQMVRDAIETPAAWLADDL